MREIKFRGKRLDNGEWVYGYLVHKKVYRDNGGVEHYLREWEENHSYIYEENIYTNCEDYPVTFIEVLPETVGQYTGVKDKTGAEIYEGDVLKEKDNEGYFVIVWDSEYATNKVEEYGFKTYYYYGNGGEHEKEFVERIDSYYLSDFNLADMEIVDTIHDNPDDKISF